MNVQKDANCVNVQAEKGAGQIKNNKTADSGGKIIFEEPVLCAQLFNDYVDVKGLKGIRPEDIEDVTERFIPMFTEQRDADVIKKVKLPDKREFFITLIEHKSGVDYNVVMQILRYMAFIWEDYEKEQEKDHPGISKTKKFKYPPILPIVYYEGSKEWTACRKLSGRVTLNKAFRDFIPDFKYYLISLKDHDREELISRKNGLSLVMLINSIKNAEEFRSLELPEDYLDSLFKGSPENVLKVIANVIAVVLRKQNVPEDEIQGLVDQIKRREHMGLFDEWQGFDVQEERRIGRDMGEEIKLIKQVCSKITKGWDVSKIADLFEEDEAHIQSICDTAANFAPDYDAEKIYAEMTKEKDDAAKSDTDAKEIASAKV